MKLDLSRLKALDLAARRLNAAALDAGETVNAAAQELFAAKKKLGEAELRPPSKDAKENAAACRRRVEFLENQRDAAFADRAAASEAWQAAGQLHRSCLEHANAQGANISKREFQVVMR